MTMLTDAAADDNSPLDVHDIAEVVAQGLASTTVDSLGVFKVDR